MKARYSVIVSVLLVGALALAIAGCGANSGGDGGSATVVGTAVDDGTIVQLLNAVAQVGGQSSPPTGADGAFVVTGAPTGAQAITVTAPNHVTTSETVALQSGTNSVGLFYVPPILAPGTGAVTGIMVLAGSMAAVNGGNVQSGQILAKSRSDGSGRFTIYGIPAGLQVYLTFFDPATNASASTHADVVAGQVTSIPTVSLSVGPPPPPDTSGK